LRRAGIKTAEMKQASELRSRSAAVIGHLVFETVVEPACDFAREDAGLADGVEEGGVGPSKQILR